MTPASKIPSSALSTGTRAFSTTSASLSPRRPSLFGFGLSARLEEAASWLNRPTQLTTTGTSVTGSHSALLQGQQHSIQHRHAVPSPHHLTAALFSTSAPSQRSSSSSKEEEDLYQALTVSFRTRIAEQDHKPEDEYKAVIERWTAHAQKDAMTRQRTRARKERLASAIKHRDIVWIQKEQERLELEADGSADDHFYIIQAWIKVGELKRATLAFEWTETRNIPPTVRTLAALTRAHARSGNLAVAGAMVQKMINHHLHPSQIYDLSALLEYYIKMTPTPATSPVTSSPLSSLSTSASATATIETATTATPIPPTLESSSSPSRTKSLERVQEIWRAIEPQLKLTASSAANSNAIFAYRTYLVYLVTRAQDLETAVDLIDRMAARNLSPELERYQKTAVAVLQALTEQGYLTEVQTLLHQKDAALGKVVPQLVWSELMEAYIERGENQKSRWIYNDMIRSGVQPSAMCKKLYSNLQVLGGTTDRESDPTVATTVANTTHGDGHGRGGRGGGDDGNRRGGNGRGGSGGGGNGSKVQQSSSRSNGQSNFFNLLFNRQPKPVIS
ncbi:hypothetical protein BGZ83_011330 [Gryganskiella cystojenkinii]|nr:hypothetical protein BGZ83_011330 [Gryganskiella cystojenkinii]